MGHAVRPEKTRCAPAVTVTLTTGHDAQAADLALVDGLLRITVAARRIGWTVRVDGAGDDLRDLFVFLGLGELVACDSGFELGGQPEGREERRVEVVVDPGDAPF
jgi:hypothetical protein